MSVHPTRLKVLNPKGIRKGQYVFYWMQQSQRAFYNHALAHAISQANRLNQGVLVGFGLTANYLEANLRHYTFMLEGLRETQATLAEKRIKMVVQYGSPTEIAVKLGRKASLIICDRGYLRHQRQWRKTVAENAECQVVQIESDVVVPIEVVSNKAEYAARTIRPKIHQHLDNYLVELRTPKIKITSMHLQIKSIDLTHTDSVLKKISLDRGVSPVSHFIKGGTDQAKQIFTDFLHNRLHSYATNSNQPQTDDISHMSPYLHFGQISPLYLALRVLKKSRALSGRMYCVRGGTHRPA